MKSIPTKILLNKIIKHQIDFNNDKIKLYIVDRRLELNNKLSYKYEIQPYIIYEQDIKLHYIENIDDVIYVKYYDALIEYDCSLYETFGNLAIYNETTNCIMSLIEMDQNLFDNHKPVKEHMVKKFYQAIFKEKSANIKTIEIRNIVFVFSNILTDMDFEGA